MHVSILQVIMISKKAMSATSKKKQAQNQYTLQYISWLYSTLNTAIYAW